jgi:hypothetical protein
MSSSSKSSKSEFSKDKESPIKNSSHGSIYKRPQRAKLGPTVRIQWRQRIRDY